MGTQGDADGDSDAYRPFSKLFSEVDVEKSTTVMIAIAIPIVSNCYNIFLIGLRNKLGNRPEG